MHVAFAFTTYIQNIYSYHITTSNRLPPFHVPAKHTHKKKEKDQKETSQYHHTNTNKKATNKQTKKEKIASA